MGEEIKSAKLIYDFYFDEAARLGQRTDWFLIFHAILLEAFFAAPPGIARVIVGTLGLLTSYLWLVTGYRARWLSRHLGACMENPKLMGQEFSRTFERIFEMRRKGLPPWIQWAMPVPAFGVAIPCAFTAAWLALLLWAGQTSLVVVVVIGFGSAVIATIGIKLLRSGPCIAQELTDGLLDATTRQSANKSNTTSTS
jgi:hypothetical protein